MKTPSQKSLFNAHKVAIETLGSNLAEAYKLPPAECALAADKIMIVAEEGCALTEEIFSKYPGASELKTAAAGIAAYACYAANIARRASQ